MLMMKMCLSLCLMYKMVPVCGVLGMVAQWDMGSLWVQFQASQGLWGRRWPRHSALPSSCHLGAGVCSGWCVAGARWAGASSQTVNMAKQAILSAVLLAARREKITPVRQRGCRAEGVSCHSEVQPTCHPGYFSICSQAGSRAGDGS